MVLEHLNALRRVYIDREENQLIAKLFHSEADRLVLRVGSLIFSHIGQLLPEQLKAFHNSDHIFPVRLCFLILLGEWFYFIFGRNMKFRNF